MGWCKMTLKECIQNLDMLIYDDVNICLVDINLNIIDNKGNTLDYISNSKYNKYLRLEVLKMGYISRDNDGSLNLIIKVGKELKDSNTLQNLSNDVLLMRDTITFFKEDK